ncbi:MAG: hypothetical protein KIT09_16015 [Bryobacteraceae bacterium]|nr:hypothetical protein [Bryobacteraceae bacterium]
MFYFEQMFNTALDGIVSSGLMSAVLTTAYGILLASLLFSAYEAWARGGDVRALGSAGVKYLALGLLFLNAGAVYDSVFRSVIEAFNQIAHAMAGAGPTDVFRGWLSELRAAAGWPTMLNFVTGTMAGLISTLLLIIAMILYPVAYLLFSILYAFYGAILYVIGPLVLALMPSMGVGSLARRYGVNLMIFASWGLIYGIFCRLAIALNVNSMAAITGAGSFAGAMAGASQEVLLAASSILFSLCIFLIPFLARRIVEGDVGTSMFAMLAGTAALVHSTIALARGPAGGWGAVTSPSSGDGGGGSGAANAGGSGGSSITGSNTPPPAPTPRPSRVSIPHSVGWVVGAGAALGYKGAAGAVSAVRGMVSGNPPPSSQNSPKQGG